MQHVVLVDKEDNEIGIMDKMEAHRKGILHRAFSVLLFNDAHEILMQKRAINKYHSRSLWSNTCCSHPMPGESIIDAATRRLHEEMGISCVPKPFYSFLYQAELDQQLIEHEFDHVLCGSFNASPNTNPNEVADWKYMPLDKLRLDMNKNPEHYTVWFRSIIDHKEFINFERNHLIAGLTLLD